MYNETTLTVNVDATSKKLSDTAVNMWIANEVVLELDQPDAPDVESGKSFYAQMTKKVLSVGAQGVTDGYYFTFDTGDVFFSATANGYPELVGDTLNIGTGNGGPSSGDAPLLVEILEGPADNAKSASNTKSSPQQYHLSKTASEIWDANVVVAMLDQLDDTEGTGNIYYSDLWDKEIHAGQKSATRADGYYFMLESGDEFYAATADDYPVLEGELKIGTTTPGGGSGGGALVVHETVTMEDEQEVHTLDATYADIVAAGFCALHLFNSERGLYFVHPLTAYGYIGVPAPYAVGFMNVNQIYATPSENGYPYYTMEK